MRFDHVLAPLGLVVFVSERNENCKIFFFGSSITNLTQEEHLTVYTKHCRRGAVVSVTRTLLHF